jgi:TPR repeat protein
MELAGAEMGLMAQKKPDADDLFGLGIFYSTGEQVMMDLVAAHKWFNLAASAGNGEAADHRQDLAMEMSTGQIATAQREAREWLTRH